MSRKNPKPVCPITNQVLTYSGRGRPPVFHPSVPQAERAAYWASLGVTHKGRARRS